ARYRAQLAEQVHERAHASGERAQELDVQIAFVESKIRERELPADKTPHHGFTAQALALHAHEWKKNRDTFILDAIDRFKVDVDKLALDAATVQRIETPGKTANERPLAYATEMACATCHKIQAEVWASSKHAQAWSDLEKSESQKDPDCV